jgi:hypothetical protein
MSMIIINIVLKLIMGAIGYWLALTFGATAWFPFAVGLLFAVTSNVSKGS